MGYPASASPAETPAPAAAPAAPPTPWSLSARLAFRFFFIYWLLYSLPFPLTLCPDKESVLKAKSYCPRAAPAIEWVADVAEPASKNLNEYVIKPYTDGEQFVVPWVGKHVLGLKEPITYFMSGSGDKTSDYVRNLINLVAAAVGMLLWTALAFVIPLPGRWTTLLHDFLRIYVRFVLGATMLTYGGFKVVPMQMPTPGLDRLMEPVGEMSPMGILWTFMGASTAFSVFAGAGECLGGFLLFFRRTTTLGALVTIAVMANVSAMNYCYDVPVKLYSTNLLLMAAFLLAPDLGRLANVLLLNRPAPSRDLGPPWKNIRWLYWPLLALKLLVVAWLLYSHVFLAVDSYLNIGSMRPRAELVGIFDVEELKRDGVTQPLLATDAKLWRRLIFNEYAFRGRGFCTIRQMDDQLVRCSAVYQKAEQKLTLTRRDLSPQDAAYAEKPPPGWTFGVARPDEQHMTLEGEVDGVKLFLRLKLVKPPEFQLLTRGCHWVQEYPYNR